MPKPLLAVLLTATIAVLAIAGTVAAQSTQRFNDVPPDHYAYDAINWMVDNNITRGCGDGTNFCPERPLNRAHIAAFLYRALAPDFSGVGNDTTPDMNLEPGFYSIEVLTRPAPDWESADGLLSIYLRSRSGNWRILDWNEGDQPGIAFVVQIEEADEYWFNTFGDDKDMWSWWITIARLPDLGTN